MRILIPGFHDLRAQGAFEIGFLLFLLFLIIDLVVAFPFSLMVQALCSYTLPWRNAERRTAFVFGTFVTLVWLALLSFSTGIFWISPIIPWAMILATVSASIVLWHRLLAAGTQVEPVRVRAATATA